MPRVVAPSLKPNTSTEQLWSKFPSIMTRLSETFKLCMTDMHPPPPTAWLIKVVTLSNTTLTALPLKKLPIIETDGDSSVPIAPPHAEHGVVVETAFGHAAVLFSKKQEVTARELDVAPIAPPVWAVLLKNLQSLTVTMLPLAETAPPTALETLKLAQF
jgi:hypothetical protein